MHGAAGSMVPAPNQYSDGPEGAEDSRTHGSGNRGMAAANGFRFAAKRAFHRR